jgi:hypothetical protein
VAHPRRLALIGPLSAVALIACGARAAPTAPFAEHPVALRAHGWQLWAPAAWERWTPSERLFADASPSARPRLRAPRPFRVGDLVETEALPVMFDVVFDPAATAHLRRHGLARRVRLAGARELPAFPPDAIAVKQVWYPIRAHGLTAMPIWDGEPADERGHPARTWRRAIAVDPDRTAVPPDETAEVELGGTRQTVHVVALADFVAHRLDDEGELVSARAAARDSELARGDYLALVAAHVTTKELPDWVWVTFWWHDRPDAGPYAADRPTGIATHYLMDATVSADRPCFNPWLEARFPNGTRSNCISCHQRAVVGATDYLPVTIGRLRVDDPYFAGRASTDFVWSIALEAR